MLVAVGIIQCFQNLKRHAMQLKKGIRGHEAVTKEGEWIEILLDRRPVRELDDKAPEVRMIGAMDGVLAGSVCTGTFELASGSSEGESSLVVGEGLTGGSTSELDTSL